MEERNLPRDVPGWAGWLGAGLGFWAVLSGLGLLGGGALVAIFAGKGGARFAAFLLGVAVITLALGILLFWQSWEMVRGRPSGPWRMPRLRWLSPLFGAVLLAGWGLSRMVSESLLPYILLPFHLLASILPSLGVLSLVTRSGPTGEARPPSWRSASAQAAYGAFLAPLGAITMETFAIGALVVVGAVALVLLGGGEALETMGQEMARLSSAEALGDPAWLWSSLADYWPFFLPLALGVLVVPPLVEEALKGLGVAAAVFRRPSPGRAFIWGATAGASFAAMEDVLYMVGTLGSEWAANMALRTGGTCIHSLGAGLVGLGWYYALVERRRWLLGMGLLLAATLHGMWNLLAFALMGLGFSGALGKGDVPLRLSFGLLQVGVLVLMVGLFAVAVLSLYYLSRSLRDRAEA